MAAHASPQKSGFCITWGTSGMLTLAYLGRSFFGDGWLAFFEGTPAWGGGGAFGLGALPAGCDSAAIGRDDNMECKP